MSTNKLTPEIQALLIDEFVPIFQAHPNLQAAINTLVEEYDRLHQPVAASEREAFEKSWCSETIDPTFAIFLRTFTPAKFELLRDFVFKYWQAALRSGVATAPDAELADAIRNVTEFEIGPEPDDANGAGLSEAEREKLNEAWNRTVSGNYTYKNLDPLYEAVKRLLAERETALRQEWFGLVDIEAMKKWLGELWGSAEFDCGPQDYEYMVKQSIEALRNAKEREALAVAGAIKAAAQTAYRRIRGLDGPGDLAVAEATKLEILATCPADAQQAQEAHDAVIRQEERERCRQVVCDRCRNGDGFNKYRRCHVYPDGTARICAASEICALPDAVSKGGEGSDVV